MTTTIRLAPLQILLALALASSAPLAFAQHDAHAGHDMPAASSDAPVTELSFSGAWVRATPPGAANAAGYVTIANHGDQALDIVGIASPVAASAMMHSSTIEDGVMRMRHIAALEIAPGETASFAPEQDHLMLMDIQGPLAEGEVVTIRFTLSDGRSLSADFPVRSSAPTE